MFCMSWFANSELPGESHLGKPGLRLVGEGIHLASIVAGAPMHAVLNFSSCCGTVSRRRDCHFDDTPFFISLLKHLIQVEGGAAE